MPHKMVVILQKLSKN